MKHVFNAFVMLFQFLHRHELKVLDVIGYVSIASYIPLDYWIFTPNNMAWYFSLPITLVAFTFVYIVLRLLLDLMVTVFKYPIP